MVNMGGEVTAVAAATTAVVGATPAPAQAVITSHPASSTAIPLDPLQKRAKTVTEAVRASSRSAVVTKRRVINRLMAEIRRHLAVTLLFMRTFRRPSFERRCLCRHRR
jgi:hypothetical protein